MTPPAPDSPAPDLDAIEKRLRANAMDGRGEWAAVLTADMEAVLALARHQAEEIERKDRLLREADDLMTRSRPKLKEVSEKLTQLEAEIGRLKAGQPQCSECGDPIQPDTAAYCSKCLLPLIDLAFPGPREKTEDKR